MNLNNIFIKFREVVRELECPQNFCLMQAHGQTFPKNSEILFQTLKFVEMFNEFNTFFFSIERVKKKALKKFQQRIN